MRLKVRSLRQAVKGDLAIEFVPQRLTSYGGLELVQRYFRKLAIIARLRTALAAIPSDYGSGRVALLGAGGMHHDHDHPGARLRRSRRDGHGPRHPRRGPLDDLRAVLHNEAAGHRPRVAGLGIRLSNCSLGTGCA
jgi:hypothetical protein